MSKFTKEELLQMYEYRQNEAMALREAMGDSPRDIRHIGMVIDLNVESYRDPVFTMTFERVNLDVVYSTFSGLTYLERESYKYPTQAFYNRPILMSSQAYFDDCLRVEFRESYAPIDHLDQIYDQFEDQTIVTFMYQLHAPHAESTRERMESFRSNVL